jgi:site-specific DNA-cytosine methylase
MKVMWDICSGLGGASEAFIQSSDWIVVRIENNPLLQGVEETELLDVIDWQQWAPNLIDEYGEPDLIWCSPPCREFSQGFNAPAPTAARNGEEFEPDMSIVYACEDIIAYAEPQYWIIENVRGAIPHFEHLGKFKQQISSFYLWGNFPTIDMPSSFHHEKRTQDVHLGNPLRSNLKAYVPFDVSYALLEAVSNQTTLDRWYS